MNKRQKTVDTTYLGFVDYAASRLFIHRDYLAHCLRFSHVARYLQQQRRYQTVHLLDVGCGREAPLPRLMYSMKMTHRGGSYTGVDYGPVPWPEHIAPRGKFNARFLEKTDFATMDIKDLHQKTFDLVTCFEMLEHVEPDHAYRTLARIHEALHPKRGVALLSTPCYDPHVGAADNHVNEMSHVGFRALLGLAGLGVKQVWGTFASQRDYKGDLADRYGAVGQNIFDELTTYYDSNVVACLFAPLFPAQARNCLWEVASCEPFVAAGAEALATTAHGSSDQWPKTLKALIKEVKRG
jgi:hypothetical protein